MRIFIAVAVAMAVLTQAAYAQHKAAPPGLSEKEKAAIAEKRAREKDIDEAYKATIKQMPDKQQATDPWGNLRAPSAAK